MVIPNSASDWENAMMGSPKSAQIISNFRDEENVPRGISGPFFRRIGKKYSATIDPVQLMESILVDTPETALAGPEAKLNPKQELTHFARLARLADLPAMKKAGAGVPSIIANPQLVDKITMLPLGNHRGLVWATLNGPVADDLGNGIPVDSVVDKLGIPDQLLEPFYRVEYSTSDVEGKCAVPTVLDAGHLERFRPSAKGASHGMTHAIIDGRNGYPEVVHGRCDVRRPKLTVLVPGP